MRVIPALLIIMAMIVAGCGSDDGAAPDPTEQSSGGGTGDGGDADSSDSAAGDLPKSVPEGFPVAIPAGWEIDVNEEMGLTVSAARLLYSSDEYDNLVAFYDEWTGSDSSEYSRTEASDSIIYTRLESPTYLISITRDHEERDQTWTLLQASGSVEGG